MPQQLELPRFTAKKSKDFPLFLIVMCPRADCPGTEADRPFLVAAREWLRPYRRTHNDKTIVITGRSCPYCFRAARLPARSQIR